MEKEERCTFCFSTRFPLESRGYTLNLSFLVFPKQPKKKPEAHPFGAKEIVVEGPKALARVVAAVSPAHQVLDHQANVYQADSVVRGQVSLLGRKETTDKPKKDSVVY